LAKASEERARDKAVELDRYELQSSLATQLSLEEKLFERVPGSAAEAASRYAEIFVETKNRFFSQPG